MNDAVVHQADEALLSCGVHKGNNKVQEPDEPPIVLAKVDPTNDLVNWDISYYGCELV